MNPAKTHLLVCGCSARIPVATGQAGGRVGCPACGVVLDVPRLRDFSRLERAADAPGPRRRWDAARGLLLAGTVLAAGCSVAAASLVSLAARSAAPAMDAEAMRAAVAAADTLEVHRAWQHLAEWGVDRPPTDDERRRQAVAASVSGLATALWSLAGIGAAVAVVAAGVVFSRGARRLDQSATPVTLPAGHGR